MKVIILPGKNDDSTLDFSQYPTSGEHFDKVDDWGEDTYYDSNTHIYIVTSGDDLFYPGNFYPQTDLGTINSLTVHAYAKISSGSSVQGCPEFKVGGNWYNQNPVAITNTTYSKKSTATFNQNPDTNQPWSWSDVQNVAFGFYAADVTGTLYVTKVFIELDITPGVGPEIISIDKDGSYLQCSINSGTVHYVAVYDDYLSDWVYAPAGTTKIDTFGLCLPVVIPNSVITGITVTGRFSGDYPDSASTAKIVLYKSGYSLQYSAEFYTYYLGGETNSHTWNTNPFNSDAAWTWDDLVNLQIGVWLHSTEYTSNCQTLLVKVYYVMPSGDTGCQIIGFGW